MGIVDDYAKAVYDEKKFFAAYPPNTPLELGSFGTLDGKVFRPCGSLRRLARPIPLVAETTPLDRARYRSEFKLKDAHAIKLGAGADVQVPGVTTTRASLKIEFTSDFGAYVALSGMKVVVPRDLTAVAQELVRRAQLPDSDPDHWDTRMRVVTQLVVASKVTVLLSSKGGSKIVLEAKANVPTLDLADANAGFDIVFDDTAEEQFIPEKIDPKGVTPFFWLMKIERGLFGLGKPKPGFESFGGEEEPELGLAPEGESFALEVLEERP